MQERLRAFAAELDAFAAEAEAQLLRLHGPALAEAYGRQAAFARSAMARAQAAAAGEPVAAAAAFPRPGLLEAAQAAGQSPSATALRPVGLLARAFSRRLSAVADAACAELPPAASRPVVRALGEVLATVDSEIFRLCPALLALLDEP